MKRETGALEKPTVCQPGSAHLSQRSAPSVGFCRFVIPRPRVATGWSLSLNEGRTSHAPTAKKGDGSAAMIRRNPRQDPQNWYIPPIISSDILGVSLRACKGQPCMLERPSDASFE